MGEGMTKTVTVERAQLEQWLQAFKKIHDDKHSHWDLDEEISAIEKSLEPIAMAVMKSDEADFWRWWKPYQLKDCWRLELVARDAWMAAKINTDADIAYLITKVKEAIQYPSRWDTAAYPTLQSALHELTARYKVSGCETLKTEQHASDAITWTPETGYVFSKQEQEHVGFYDAENKDLRREIPMGEDGDWWQPVYTHPPVPTAQEKGDE